MTSWNLWAWGLVVVACSSSSDSQDNAPDEITCADYLAGNYVPITDSSILSGRATQRRRIEECHSQLHEETAAQEAAPTGAPRVSVLTVPVAATAAPFGLSFSNFETVVSLCVSDRGLTDDGCRYLVDWIDVACTRSLPQKGEAFQWWFDMGWESDSFALVLDSCDEVF